MDTFFYTNAADYTNFANRVAEDTQHLKSWAITVPARVNYVADAVANAAMAPFNLLKALYGTVIAIVTWGHDTTVLNMALKDFKENVDHFLISSIGVFFTKAGVDLRKNKNFGAELLGVLMISIVGLSAIKGGWKGFDKTMMSPCSLFCY